MIYLQMSCENSMFPSSNVQSLQIKTEPVEANTEYIEVDPLLLVVKQEIKVHVHQIQAECKQKQS
jgi:hypothetical protein